MNTASLDLCKELYSLSGWQETSFIWAEHGKDSFIMHNSITKKADDYPPAYDLGYLLRKLPSGAGVIKNSQNYTARRPNMLRKVF